jgi:hypothetical protein
MFRSIGSKTAAELKIRVQRRWPSECYLRVLRSRSLLDFGLGLASGHEIGNRPRLTAAPAGVVRIPDQTDRDFRSFLTNDSDRI